MTDDLSKPPTDAVLLQQIVATVLAEYPVRSVVSMTRLLADVAPQCPAGIVASDILREVVSQIGVRGLAVQFDKPD